MKYTNSQDGKARCTVRLEMRLTPQEYAEIAKIAKLRGETVKAYLTSKLLDEERLYWIMQDDKKIFGVNNDDD